MNCGRPSCARKAIRLAEDEFLEHVLDQLLPLGLVLPRAMSGGFRLYFKGVFFGIVAGGRLYFKTDALTRPSYENRGMGSFAPAGADRPAQRF
jgi:DNA transformation protein and related proteins